MGDIKTIQAYLLAILPYQQKAFAQIHRFGGERPALLFRGKKARQPLVAKISKFAKTIANPILFERERLSFLKRKLVVPYSDWDIVALAQHHGIATRFLDWTSNALTALWFALGRNRQPYDETGASEVWILETEDNDFNIPEQELSPIPAERGSKTVIFTPRMVDSRILLQDSYMMRQVYEKNANGISSNSLEIRPVDGNPTFRGRMYRLQITANEDHRKRLLSELESLGYTESRILPDRDDWCTLKNECDALVADFK